MFRKEKVFPRAFEELSAYIDGQVSEEEATAIEAKLAHSAQLQRAHDQIKALRAATRALPQRKAPRNFILTRAEAAQAKRSRNWSRVFGLAFSLCAVFLVVLFGYDGLSNNLFAMKAEKPQAAISEDMAQSYALRDAAESAPESPAAAPEEPIEEKAVEEEAALLTWGTPSAKTAEQRDAMEVPYTGGPTVSPNQPETAFSVSTYSAQPTEDELVRIHLDPTSGKVTICDPDYGCDYGSGIQNISNPESKNEILVDPALIYYDQEAGMLKLCPEPGTCPSAEEALIAVQAVKPEEETESYDTAFPLILGMDHENEGELLSASPQIDAGTLEAETVPDDEVQMEEAPAAGTYDDDSDHQNYLRDQRVLWLKIGLVGLTILFGIVWLIIRRR